MTSTQLEQPSRRTLANALLALALLAPATGFSAGKAPEAKSPAASVPTDQKLDTKAQQAAPTAFAAKEPKAVLQWGIGDGKSYWVPAFEIVGFDSLMNLFNRNFVDKQVYNSNRASISENLHSKWIVDTDPFSVNQFLHPYQGSIYHGFARSAGLDFWESMGYTFLGSAFWEIAGERTTPSINDQVASGIGGSFLGEPLYRIARLLLESSGDSRPGFWTELGAAAISPSTGFNRWANGGRFDGVFRSYQPAVYTRIELGASLVAHVHSTVNLNTDITGPPIAQAFTRREVNADFTMAYGLPGKPGYSYTRPFDYFHFEFTASTANIFENILVRGLLYGKDYERGANFRGVWGLYGNYDYIAPQVFRVSTTAASFGTTGQAWLSRTVAVQGTALAGLGYGAAGTIHAGGVGGAAAAGSGQRDYHYGMTPQELIALRFIFGDLASIDMTARDYYVSRVGATETKGSENIARADVSVTLRVYNLHGITLRYVESRRDARYENRPRTHQSVGTVSLVYSFLGQTRFGAVDWRPKSAGGP